MLIASLLCTMFLVMNVTYQRSCPLVDSFYISVCSQREDWFMRSFAMTPFSLFKILETGGRFDGV